MMASARACLAAAAVLSALTLSACPRRRPVPIPPPPLAVHGRTDGLNVFLTWTASVDLDLYLTDPTLETVYFGNNPSRTGGQLLRDTRCGDVRRQGPFWEQARVLHPKPGRYRVGVDFIECCAAARQPVGFRVLVEIGGAQREVTGIIDPEQFQPLALEFELRPQPAGGALTLAQEQP